MSSASFSFGHACGMSVISAGCGTNVLNDGCQSSLYILAAIASIVLSKSNSSGMNIDSVLLHRFGMVKVIGYKFLFILILALL